MSLLTKHTSRKVGTLKKSKSKSIDNDYTVQDLASLRRKRTIAYKRLSKALEIGKLALSDNSQLDLFLSYHQEVKQIASNFEDAHFVIIRLLDDEEIDDSEMQESFDDMYFRVLSMHRSLTKNDSSHIPKSSSSNIRLPKLVLPNYSGNIKLFPEYIDTYNALIHNSTSLSDTEKFHYLISSLSGDALAVVKTFPMSHEYYRDAYEALVARYKCKRTLAFTCWRDILSIHFKYTNAYEFQKSLDQFEENLSILKTLDLPTAHWDFVLVYHILSKLDKDLRRSFEEKYSDIELPSYDQLKRFLRSKCEALLRDTHFLDLHQTNKSFLKTGTPMQFQPKRMNVSHTLIAATDATPADNKSGLYYAKCSYCNETHSISSCPDFLQKSLEERMKIANDKHWCFNCLKPSHQLKNCTSIFSCRTCKRKHHTLLHRDKTIESNPISSLVSRSESNTTVLLATAIVQVRDASGNLQSFRALFDTGSQSNFITESAMNQLKLKPRHSNVSVSGLGEAETSITGGITCSIATNDRVVFDTDMYVIRKICGDQPIAHLNTSNWSHIQSLPLADPGFDIPGPIDILFAANVFVDSLLDQHIKGGVNQPTAFNSIFGWLLLGKTSLSSHTLLHSVPNIDIDLNSLVQRFWELDSLPSSSRLTPDDELCEKKFINDHTRDISGRYMVRIPFKENTEPIFEGSRNLALRRFYAIERRLSRDSNLRSQYTDFMSDYIDSGHMSLVPANEVGLGKYYIPHHCVLRPDSTTTRLRVVFDASAKDLNHRSLNDTQLIGPKLQPNIVSILLHLREHKIVFMADARQMYRQILISPDHRDYQRIFWRNTPNETLQEYRLNTVTYGLASSPYLACRTLRQLAKDWGNSYPLAKQIILSDIYIDDVATGFQSLEAAQEAKSQLIALFSHGCFMFQLRKWISNDMRLLSDIPKEDCLMGSVSLDNTESGIFKVLGLKWDPSSDSFLFEIQSLDRPCTKRSILGELARIFDPLGFLSPVTIQAKCLIQKLWVLGVSWDETPPVEVVNSWNTYREQLPLLGALKIPRRFTCTDARSCELHGFCDSSEAAYGAVIYLRVSDSKGKINVFLGCSKARVVPLKRTSLPRLELCAAVLLSDLYKFVHDASIINIKIDATYFWSDSTVVLSWLRSHSSRWATFVANRVSHIQDITPAECWHHVSSGDNPADICSRGQFPSEIVGNELWWAGPSWLSKDYTFWPPSSITITYEDKSVMETETRKSIALTSNTIIDPTKSEDIINSSLNRFSSLSKLINVFTYIYRFINNTRNPNQANRNCYLNNVERHNALMRIVKHVQNESFVNEILCLKSQKSLPKPFRKLNPFIDNQGILRVGGRISRSGLEYEQRHPAFLPSNHQLTSLIIDFIHRNYLHPGINTTNFLLLQQFWIVSAKRIIRRQLAKCIQCYRTNPRPLQPFMSNLPSYRVNQVKPFSVVGVDFGGPFRIKLGSHRGAKIDKAYLCLFICLATKAVHLEVVSTLSTEGFVAALRRFIGRRGRCNVIHADCGTNFVGARNQLSTLMEQASSAQKIEFKFNPPTAPHFGGVWEIQIRAAKSHLYRVVGNQVLTFEELSTLFIQIESVLNSRPLCPISSDPNDLSVLTPGHFLTLEPLTAVPDEDLSNTKVTRLHRWQLLQSFHQHFWFRWKHEYLNSLTQRAKWTKKF
ncbi:uncharacterized protein LOC131855445 [Achroia grisella]|uniref:uncharacterized protein LOC131855445 n=1 Tax=Achroia grisella TaxID=688607 RepID=UPI0027D2CFC6|nr:uncharacterized protein LOC131855445 [Achroia grisella]